MILVTGGTGFVGRHLVVRLVEAGQEVRVLARKGTYLPTVEVLQGDVRDMSALVSAARGCTAVLHLVGIIREGRGSGFRDVHVGGTRNAIRACQEAGVSRLLHMSALGAKPNARSRYHRTKWEAEELVRASGLDATIFRPSVMFGSGNSFLPQVRDLLYRGPFIPIVGNGMSLLQPIWVEDVAACFIRALSREETVNHTYELGGPEAFGFEELLDQLAEIEGVRKPKLHLPPTLLRPAVAVLSRLLPRFPLSSDQLTMLLDDNVCDITEMERVFNLHPALLRDHLAD